MTPSLLLAVVFAVGAPAPKDAPKETPKLEGDWIIESFEGEKGGPTENVTFRFTEGKVLIMEPKREKPEEANITVDLKAKPATIDIKPTNAPPEIVVRGIFEIKGDTLKLCFTKMGERPTAFKGDADKHTVLITLKRVKPAK